jgi:hypothetical protein
MMTQTTRPLRGRVGVPELDHVGPWVVEMRARRVVHRRSSY